MTHEPVAIETGAGPFNGLRRGGILEFRGIPYARPPIGPLRWRLPEPLAPGSGPRDATRFSAACPQNPSRLDRMQGSALSVQSEDCLYLNVWTPGCDDAKRPVLVWIHGGAFTIGAGHQAIYNGHKFAARDCVLVTINYRLGAFGFLTFDDATGAEGLADQVAALEWVKTNIAAFGGDPGNVTIFGESAGGMSVAALLATPSAQGLFHKAIAQSGAAHIGREPERSERVTQAFLDILGADKARLRDVPWSAILKAQTTMLTQARLGKRRLGGLPFQPACGNSVLPVRPIDAIRGGMGADIPLLTGTTKEEWKLFTAADPRSRIMSATTFAGHARRFSDTLVDVYNEGSPYQRLNAMMTDKTFMVPATRLLEAMRAPSFAYRFDWRSPFLGGIFGACHALELGFVFGTHADGRAASFFGKGLAADALSNAMMDAWTAFARTGNPGWPRYDTATRQTMIFGDGDPHLVSAPNETHRAAWSMLDRRLGP
jgi:para-nitrobenzyl esterase